MPGRPFGTSGLGLAPSRCRCGHWPLAHLRVVAVDPSRPEGSYRLADEGSCERCGPSVCPRLRPAT